MLAETLLKDLGKRPKALIAKLGLDPHWKGAILVAYMLKNAGFDVIYIGNALPDDIIKTAIDEDVDVIGVNSLGGAHISLGLELIELLKERNMLTDRVVVIGGVIPPEDINKLLKAGYDAVFISDHSITKDKILRVVMEKLKNKRKTVQQ